MSALISWRPKNDYLGVRDLTIGWQQEVCGIFLGKPADLIDLLLNFQTLQIVKLGLVTLERAVDVILRTTLRDVLTLPKDKENRQTCYYSLHNKMKNGHPSVWIIASIAIMSYGFEKTRFPFLASCCRTSCSCWKMTILPPRSPVANSSPEWLNSTAEMMSAGHRDTGLLKRTSTVCDHIVTLSVFEIIRDLCVCVWVGGHTQSLALQASRASARTVPSNYPHPYHVSQ